VRGGRSDPRGHADLGPRSRFYDGSEEALCCLPNDSGRGGLQVAHFRVRKLVQLSVTVFFTRWDESENAMDNAKKSRMRALGKGLWVGIATIVALAMATSQLSDAAEITYGADWQRPMTFRRTDPHLEYIYAVGVIEADSAKQLQALLDAQGIQAGATVVFHSPGGNAAEGMAIGRLIRARRLNTNIGQYERVNLLRIGAGECDSACSLAFLGGIRRSVAYGSHYGVHDAALNDPSVTNAFAQGQVQAAAEADYYTEMGVDPKLLGLKNQYDSSTG
jgi:hypothetical protein